MNAPSEFCLCPEREALNRERGDAADYWEGED
jgi:hypothetical protein